MDRRERRSRAFALLEELLTPADYQRFLETSHYVHQRLEAGLDDTFYFHGMPHTEDNVLPPGIILAREENIAGSDLLVLTAGILFHDIGFLEQYWNNEPIGVRIATESLPDLGYTPDQIQVVSGIILATRIPQAPQNLLEQIMCDADLFNLGGADFFDLGCRLYLERRLHRDEIPTEFHPPATWKEYFQAQKQFLQRHQFFTCAAHKLRDEGKNRNIMELERLLQTF